MKQKNQGRGITNERKNNSVPTFFSVYIVVGTNKGVSIFCQKQIRLQQAR